MHAIRTQKEKINTLSSEDIIELHTLLSKNCDLLLEMDAVEPAGIKSENLLDSAVQRQHTGSGDWYKYENCFSNCATLIFGIIKNHSFHNGNKRTGLLALIKHLYSNGYVLNPALKHNDIYTLIVAISDSKLKEYANKNNTYRKWLRFNKNTKNKQLDIDNQIVFIARWLKANSTSKKVVEKGSIKVNKLKSILERKGIKLELNGVKVKVYKEVYTKFLGITTGVDRSYEREYSLGNSLTEMGKVTLKYLRRDFNLTPNDGIDNVVFFDDDYIFDQEITKYRSIIYKLSKT